MEPTINPKKYKKLKKSHKRLAKGLRASDDYNYQLVDENCDLLIENRQLRKEASVLSKLVVLGVGVLYLWAKSRRTPATTAPQPTDG